MTPALVNLDSNDFDEEGDNIDTDQQIIGVNDDRWNITPFNIRIVVTYRSVSEVGSCGRRAYEPSLWRLLSEIIESYFFIFGDVELGRFYAEKNIACFESDANVIYLYRFHGRFNWSDNIAFWSYIKIASFG